MRPVLLSCVASCVFALDGFFWKFVFWDFFSLGVTAFVLCFLPSLQPLPVSPWIPCIDSPGFTCLLFYHLYLRWPFLCCLTVLPYLRLFRIFFLLLSSMTVSTFWNNFSSIVVRKYPRALPLWQILSAQDWWVPLQPTQHVSGTYSACVCVCVCDFYMSPVYPIPAPVCMCYSYSVSLTMVESPLRRVLQCLLSVAVLFHVVHCPLTLVSPIFAHPTRFHLD